MSQKRQQTPTSNVQLERTRLSSAQKRIQSPITRKVWDVPSTRKNSPFIRMRSSHLVQSPTIVDPSPGSDNDTENHLTARINSVATPKKADDSNDLISWIQSLKIRAQDVLKNEEEEEQRFYEELEKERQKMEDENEVRSEQFEKLKELLLDQDSKIRYIQTDKHRQSEEVEPVFERFDLEEGENEDHNLHILDSAPKEITDTENSESEEQVYYESQELSEGLSEELSEDKEDEETHSQIQSELSDFEYDSEGNEIFPSDAEVIQLESSDIEDDGDEGEVKEGEEQGESDYDPSEFENKDLQYQPQPQYKSMYPSSNYPSNKPKLSDGYQSQPFRIDNGITYGQHYGEFEPSEEEEEKEKFIDQELDMEEEEELSEEENEEYNAQDVSKENSLTRHASISDIETSDSEKRLGEISQDVHRDTVMDENIASEVISDESLKDEEANTFRKQELDNNNTLDGLQEFGLLAYAALKKIGETQNTDDGSIDTLSAVDNPLNDQHILQENDPTHKLTEINHLDISQQGNDRNNSDIYSENDRCEEAETIRKPSQVAAFEKVQPDNVHEIEGGWEEELEEEQTEVPEQEREQNHEKNKNLQPETENAEVEESNSKIQELDNYTEEVYYDSDDNAPYKSPQYSVFGELTGDELSAVYYDYQDEDEDEDEFVSGLDINVTGDREGSTHNTEQAFELKDIDANEIGENGNIFQKLETTAESGTNLDQNQKSEDEFEEGETSFVSFFNDTSRLTTDKASSTSFAKVSEDFVKSLSNSAPDGIKYSSNGLNIQNLLEGDVDTADIQDGTQVERVMEKIDASQNNMDSRSGDTIGDLEGKSNNEESDHEESNNINTENHPEVTKGDEQATSGEKSDIEGHPEGQHTISSNQIFPLDNSVCKSETASNSSILKTGEIHAIADAHKTRNQRSSPALTFSGIKNLLQQIVDSPVEDSRTSITPNETKDMSSIEKVGVVSEGIEENCGAQQGIKSQEKKQSEKESGQKSNVCKQEKEISLGGKETVKKIEQSQSREERDEEATPQHESYSRIKSYISNETISTLHNNNYTDEILNEENDDQGSDRIPIEARDGMNTRKEEEYSVHEEREIIETQAGNVKIDDEQKTLESGLLRGDTQETEHIDDETGLFFSVTEDESGGDPKKQHEESKKPVDGNRELFRIPNKSSLTQQLFENVRRAVENPFLDESTPEPKRPECSDERKCPESPLKSNSDASLIMREEIHEAPNALEKAKKEPGTALQVSNPITVKSKDNYGEKALIQSIDAEMSDDLNEEAHDADSFLEKQSSIKASLILNTTEEDSERNRKASPFKRAFDYLFRHSKYKDSKARKSKFNGDGNEPSGHISKKIKLKEMDSGPPTFNGHIIMKTRSGRILGANTSPEVELASEVERREDEYVNGVANDKVKASHAMQNLTADAELVERSFTEKIKNEQTGDSIGGERNYKKLNRKDTKDVDNKIDPQERLDYKIGTENSNTLSNKGKKRSRSKTFPRRQLRGDAAEEIDVENEEKPKELPETKKSKRRTKKSLPPSERKLRSRTK